MFYYLLLLVPGMYYLKYLKSDDESNVSHVRNTIVDENVNARTDS